MGKLIFKNNQDLNDWERVNVKLKIGISKFAKWFGPTVSPIVTAVIKDTPTHRKGNSVDIAIRMKSRSHPVNLRQSLRMTDKRLLHAKLKKKWDEDPLQVAIVIENDHFHVTTALPPGIWLFDNPRMQYESEDDLLLDPHYRDRYDGQIGVPVHIYPGREYSLKPSELERLITQSEG